MRRTSQVTTGILVAALIGVGTLSPTAASAQEPVETVARFDADALETPESIAIDNHNSKVHQPCADGRDPQDRP